MKIVLLIALLLSSCSLIFSPEEKTLPDEIPSGKNQVSLSVTPEVYPLLLSENISTEKFPVVVSYDEGGFCRGKINLRGNASLRETPRSFSVDIRGDSPLAVESVLMDRVSLIPLKSDTDLVYSLLGLSFAGKCGLFAPICRVVTVRMNSDTLGTYLLIERTEDALVRREESTEFVLRRRNGPAYDVKYYEPKAGEHQLTRGDYVTSYETLHLLNTLYEGEELLGALEKRMDLTAYLRLQGLNLVLANGDYCDELFYSGSARFREGEWLPYFTFSVWDFGELFTVPHGGNFTPGSLIFCNENRFDRMIENEPVLYRRYCEQLRWVLDSLVNEASIDDYSLFFSSVLDQQEGSEVLLGGKWFSKEELKSRASETVLLLQQRRDSIRHMLN